MLGARRVSITAAAKKLQSAGMIRYHRGQISILERIGLRKQSCECYEFIERQYGRLHKELPLVLKGTWK
jgi:hypothetical protein